MNSLQPQADELVHQYVHLTGREARVQIYEHALFDYFRAGFTCEEFVLVMNFLLRENKRNQYQYSLRLGNLINDHARFMDLLGEAKSRERNRVKPPSPKQEILTAFRGVVPEQVGNPIAFCDVLAKLKASL